MPKSTFNSSVLEKKPIYPYEKQKNNDRENKRVHKKQLHNIQPRKYMATKTNNYKQQLKIQQ